jgi:FAD/FMN-containing dehydrogenase
MKQIAVDARAHTARVGAGVRAQELVAAAARHGLAPVLGECPTVGVAGLTLGGGVGWLSAKYGATCDNLLASSLVTVDGRTVVASPRSHPDLFWAIRGGGGSFGVATSFDFRLHPVADVLAGGVSYRLQDARTVLRFYAEFMASAPDELQALATLTPAAGGTINVIVVYTGDTSSGERLLAPLHTIAPVTRNTVERRRYTDTFTMPPYGEVPETPFFAVRGAYLASLSDEAIGTALECFASAPPGCAIGFDHYMHGAVCRVPATDTAFELRTPGGVHVWIAPQWMTASEEPRLMAWTTDTWQRLHAPFSGGRVYMNYQSSEGDDLSTAVFGANHARLAALKRKFDPSNVLRANTNIRPSA